MSEYAKCNLLRVARLWPLYWGVLILAINYAIKHMAGVIPKPTLNDTYEL